jgi:PEP-CTERM motif
MKARLADVAVSLALVGAWNAVFLDIVPAISNPIVHAKRERFFLADPIGPISEVPEPSTWALMLLGFAGLGFAFRRSRRKVSFA